MSGLPLVWFCLYYIYGKQFDVKGWAVIPPCPITPHPSEKSLSILPVGPLQVLEGCSMVTPEPSFLQAEQPQLPQPVLIGEVLQPSDYLRCPPLDTLQHIHVLPMLGAPELDAVVQVGSHESGIKGQNHLPRPAGHAKWCQSDLP